LNSLNRAQLTALCRLLELKPLGTDDFLRFRLRAKLNSLRADDKVILKEGVDSLSMSELQQACQVRGMKSWNLSTEQLKDQLSQWLELSLNKRIPESLLLLSRILYLPDRFEAIQIEKIT